MVALAAARADTPGCATVLHFNNAGAALPPAPVVETVVEHLRLEAQIGGYEAADFARDRLERVYDSAAALIGAHRDEIAVLENATRAWTMAFYGIGFKPGDRILTSRAEYGSNYIAYLQVARRTGASVEPIPNDEHGQLDVDELADWFVADANLVGGEDGLGQGFYLQMAGFENGRLQTAARAIGVMQAAYEDARQYALDRTVFGRPVGDYQLTKVKLARMAVTIQAARQFGYAVARMMAKGGGSMEAAMIKAYVGKAAEWVTREAMQIHGGFGYAEEYAVSRYFVDARVLSIFEGADETLCLKVIARRLVESAKG